MEQDGLSDNTTGAQVHADIHQVGTLFHNPLRLVIPVYQRPYVWTEADQWGPLWTDIRRIAEQVLVTGVAKPHFMGAVVVDHDPKPIDYAKCYVVVDGQQRLTTIQVFLEALADNYECLVDDGCEAAQDYARMARRITRNDLIRNEDDGALFKVWPMNLDQRSFNAVMSAGSPDALRAEHGSDASIMDSRLAGAYMFFYEHLSEWLGSQDDRDAAVKAMYDVVDKYLQIVVIDLRGSVDPQLIFETLNARGTPLTPSDLIKNYLFHQVQIETGDGVDLYAKYWQPFEAQYAYWSQEIGKGNAARPRLDVFVHHYLTMKTRDEVSVRKLYQAYRIFSEGTTLTTVDQLVELERFGEVYRRLDLLPHESREAVFMQRLRAMDNTTVMPFILALMGDKSLAEAERIEILGHLESYLVRRMVCGLTGKAYNRVFLDLLKATGETGITPRSVRETMLGWTEDTNVWPDDAAFRVGWMTNRAYSLVNAKVRMVLDAIEPHVGCDKAERITYVQDRLSIEHLLPQNWWDNYPLPADEADEAEKKRWELLHTWGNLTLLVQKLNSSVSNGPWSTADDLADDNGKRAKILEHSGLAINRMLANFRTWDEKAIETRAETLFDAAMKVWQRPVAESSAVDLGAA